MSIYGLQYSQTHTGAYALVLEEEEGSRRLPIIIGSAEAQAIAIEMEQMTPSRPLTHDLFRTFAQSYAIDVQEVVIYNFVDGVFYGKIVCNNGTDAVEIDCRPSDAIALAVRFKCPIFTFDFILNEAAFEKDDSGDALRPLSVKTTEDQPKHTDEFSKLSIKELEESLKAALAKENYEQASIIRDELNKRKE